MIGAALLHLLSRTAKLPTIFASTHTSFSAVLSSVYWCSAAPVSRSRPKHEAEQWQCSNVIDVVFRSILQPVRDPELADAPVELHPGDVPAGRLPPVQPRGPGHHQHLQGPARDQDGEARGAGVPPLHHLRTLLPGRLSLHE